MTRLASGRHAQVLIGRRIIDHLDLAEQTAFQIGWDFLRSNVLDEEVTQPAIPKAHDHSATPRRDNVPLCGTSFKLDCRA
jgi:hypothetical protein